MPDKWSIGGRGISVRSRLVALSFAAMLPGFCAIWITQAQINRFRQEEVRDLALRSAKLASLELERIFWGVNSLLYVVSQLPEIRDPAQVNCGDYLATLRGTLPNLTAIYATDTEGALRCSSTSSRAVNEQVQDRSYILSAINTQGLQIGTFTIGPSSGRKVLPVALAIRNTNGEAIGVLAAAIDLEWLGNQMRERGLPPEGSLTVADRKGVIIAREPFSREFVGTHIPESFMRLVEAPSSGAETITSQDGVRRVLGYVPISQTPEGIYVSTGLSTEASFAPVTNATRNGFLLAALFGLATLAAAWFVGNGVFVQPLKRLSQILVRWRDGDRSARTGFSEHSGEIGAVGAALDVMMDEIIRSQQQRDLLSNELAHRVKNTLATVQAIASATFNKADPARDVLPHFQSRVAALSHTHDVLTHNNWKQADLRSLIKSVVTPLCSDVNTQFQLDGPAVDLPAREVLGMTMVIHELCTNALKYGALVSGTGTIDVSWSLTQDAGQPRLDLSWRETGGPRVESTEGKRGFGMRLISTVFGDAARTTIELLPAGASYRVNLTIA